MAYLICFWKGRKTFKSKFIPNYIHIHVIQTLEFVFDLTSYVVCIVSQVPGD